MSPRLGVILVALLMVAVGCGDDGPSTDTFGENPDSPVETLIYVQGPVGAKFTLPVGDPDCPGGADGPSGIQAPNASHQFPGRLFLTRQLFVLENVRQPVQAVIKNTGDSPITVDLYLGINPQVTDFVIEPDTCRRIISSTALPPPTPQPRGAQIQAEVCAPAGNLDSSCVLTPGQMPTPPDQMPTPTPIPDNFTAYFATIGDIEVSHITNCTLFPILDACRTPATFFLEQPKDEIAVIMSVNPGQVFIAVRLELYVNGVLTDVSLGSNPVVSESL